MNSEEKIQKVVELARSLVGTPYKYGATMEEAPDFFDCSGFVKYVFGRVDVELPRSTILQASHGTVIDIDSIKPGDLIFTHGERGFYNRQFPQGIGHVILYLGDGKTIHAASQRIKDYPETVLEHGSVVEMNLEEVIKLNGPVVVIKRIIS